MTPTQNSHALGRRAVLGILGGTGAAAFLAACGTSSGQGGEASEPTAATNVGDVNVWYHQYGEEGTVAALKRYAQEYPDAKITLEVFPGDYDAKIAAALLANRAPDVFEHGNGPTINMIVGQQVLPVTDLFGDTLADFTPALIKRLTYQGEIYAVPQVTDVQHFVYRKSLLAAAGLTPPRSLAELANAARALTRGDTKGLFLGNDGGAVIGGPTVWSTGHDFLTETNAPDFANPDVAAALTVIAQLRSGGSLLLDSPTDWADPSAFINGRAAIQWTGLWALPKIIAALGDDVGVFPFPAVGEGGVPSVPFGAYGSAVSSRAKDPDAAKAYVKWLWVEQTERQLDWAQSYGLHVPARTSLLSKADKLNSEEPGWGIAREAAGFVNEYGRPQVPLRWTTACQSAFAGAVGRIITGGASAQSELNAVADLVRSEVARFPS